jgi:hypothetical protein
MNTASNLAFTKGSQPGIYYYCRLGMDIILGVSTSLGRESFDILMLLVCSNRICPEIASEIIFH